MHTPYPTPYRFPEVFRFRHVRPGHVFRVTDAAATEQVPAGFYIRASARKALPCTYCEFSGRSHVDAAAGARYIPASLPVVQVQV